MTSRSLRLALTALICLAAAPAAAQEIDPETGDFVLPPEQTQTQTQQTQTQQPWYAGGPTGQTQQREAPPPVRADNETPPGQTRSAGDQTSSQPSPSSSSGQDDHMRVVGNAGVGFVGVNEVPIGDAGGGVAFITAPTLGIRYWLGESIGLDIGIGLGYQGGNASAGGTSIPQDDGFAMTIHGGVPIALFHDSHFTFELIPELNLGFSTGTIYGAVSDDDRGRSGFVLSLGARAGAEIQFGFMGIPNLSLMATVGLAFQYLSAGLGENRSGSVQGASFNTWSLGTSLQGEPWDIFLGSLTAFYYFG
ncbi:MAG: hypothetical protein H6719_05365 [Sandaracinaceae bacterium]|nr:hypothetical protein [Sandaracinaceae bacterium]